MAIQGLEVGDVYKNVDDAVLNRYSASLVNGYRDELGGLNKIPGLSLFLDLGVSQPIDGLYWWDEKGKVCAVCNGILYEIYNSSGDYGAVSYTDLIRQGRTNFATDGNVLLMASSGGGPLMVRATDNNVKTVISIDADAPTNATHVIYHDSYVISNIKGTGQFIWSNVADWDAWDVADYATAETSPDELVGVHSGWGEIVLVGKETIEYWYNDGVAPFRRIDGAITEDGTTSPNTFKKVGLGWMWLNRNRQFVYMTGRNPVVLSSPFDKYIRSLNKVSDAEADVINISGQIFYVCTFPSDNKTIVYNFANKSWAEWGDWSLTDTVFKRYRGRAYCYAKNWNIHLVGDWNTGKIYKISQDSYDNVGDPLRYFLRTGHIDHGTMANKRSNRLLIRAKRGVGNVDITEPCVMVRWRDNGRYWSNEVWPSLGKIGESDFLIQLDGLGMYRTRQYEISHTDKSDFVIVSVEEDVDILSGR